MSTNSFVHRVVLLVGMMLIVALGDYSRNGRQGVKMREYGFILLAGVAGSLFGFFNDLITSSISPDYFILGKGLEAGPGLRMGAGLYGLQTGFSAGVIGGAIGLFATRRKTARPPLPVLRLLQLLWLPVAAAVVGGILLPLAFSKFDPARFAAQLEPMLNAERIGRFREVWWIHVGLYTGLAAGLTAMIVRGTKERKNGMTLRMPPPSHS
jgi:hypothetical protein